MAQQNDVLKKITPRNPADLALANLMPRRPTMGPDVPVVLWRVLRLVSLHDILGDETPAIAYLMGKRLGAMLGAKTIEELHEQLTRMKIGRLDLSVNTPDAVHLAIGECLTCDGITPPIGRAICQLEAGVIAGALETIYPGRKAAGEETKCIGGLGDDVCLIECRII
ncbi:DUF2507 domain-containing protein [Candidatus Azambacteria bacterium]|nr:DUF2507 domain-containing protein [Candidatus Azambacteria bacterium]